MKRMKILNLYAGIGGNRKLWGDEHDITAVEFNPEIAAVYADHFPNDTVIVGCAKEYLLNNFKDYGFIWSSPPCQTHSSFRQNICVRFRGTPPKYPDMSLYEQILFLQYNFDGKWVVENVKPYYEPLIAPTTTLQRHLFWSNFDIAQREFPKSNIRGEQIPQLQERHGFDLSSHKIKNKRQVLRNCVEGAVGLYILKEAKK